MKYREGADSTFTTNGVEYPLDWFLERSEKLRVQQVPVHRLKWVLNYDTPDPERVKSADLSKPILFTKDPKWGLVAIDGLHRLKKALDEQKMYLPGREIPQEWFEQAPKIADKHLKPVFTVLGVCPETAREWLKKAGYQEPFTQSHSVLNVGVRTERLYYFAMEKNLPVAMCILWNGSRYSPGVYTHPKHQGRGAAKLLLNDLSIDSITVMDENKKGKDFVIHMGFKSQGGTKQYEVYTRILPLKGLSAIDS